MVFDFDELGPQTFYLFKGELYGGFIDYADSRPDITILARYVFTLDDMIGLHWRFSYPPSEAMKDIQMEPPYSSFISETQR